MNQFVWSIFLSVMSVGFFQFYQVGGANAIEQSDNPVVLELFTSQSCSSCPLADKILNDLADNNSNIIALSCHVTYWNHLHWKDTLSKEFCNARQRSYAQSLNSKRVYTPQIIINGRHEMVGSRAGAIKRTINEESVQNSVKPISLRLSNDNLEIKLPETSGNNSYAILLLPYGSKHTQFIPSGENRGRTVQYTNPVENIISLGSWDGTSETINYDVGAIPNIKKFVVLAQKKRYDRGNNRRRKTLII